MTYFLIVWLELSSHKTLRLYDQNVACFAAAMLKNDKPSIIKVEGSEKHTINCTPIGNRPGTYDIDVVEQPRARLKISDSVADQLTQEVAYD